MTTNVGTLVTDKIVPYDSEDDFPTHEDIYGEGGYRAVATISDRDAITTERRKLGMRVHVTTTARDYRLVGGLTNDSWFEVGSDGDDTLREDLASTGVGKGSGLVSFVAAVPSPVERTVNSKVREIEVSVLDHENVRADGGITDNRAYIEEVASWLSSRGGGRVVFPEAEDPYGILTPIRLYDNVEYVGKGAASHVKNYRVSESVPGQARVFDIGNYTLAEFLSEPSYAINAVAIGASLVTFNTGAQAANFSAGDVVVLFSDANVSTVPLVQEMNEVLSVNTGAGTLTLKYPVQVAFSGGQTIRKSSGAMTDGLGYTRRFVKRAAIRNMRISTDLQWWHSGGGSWECEFTDLWNESQTIATLNFLGRSKIRMNGSFDRRIVELAVGCCYSEIEIQNAYWKTLGQTLDAPMLQFGESCHHNRVILGDIAAGGHTNATGIRFAAGYDNKVEVRGEVNMPSKSGNAQVHFGSSASGAVCARNTLYGKGRVSGNNSVFVLFDHANGSDGYDNELLETKFDGTVSVNAIRVIDGSRQRVRAATFQTGGWEVGASAVDTVLRDNIHLATTFTKSVSAPARISGIVSPTTPELQSLSHLTSNQTVTSTTPNNVVATATCAAATLQAGDAFEYELFGSVSGTNDVKDIRIDMNGTTIGSVSLTSGQTGGFYIKGTLQVVFASSTKRGVALEQSPAGVNVRSTSFSLNTESSAPTVQLQAWVGNASDSISIGAFRLTPRRLYEMSP